MKSRFFFLLSTSILASISNPLKADVIHYNFDDTPNSLAAQLFPGMEVSNTFNKKGYGDATVSEVTSIDDATIFHVNIEGYPPIVGERIPVRLLGVDTPEIKGKCESEIVKARAAKQFTVQALRSAKTIELRNMQRGKYFRILADVYLDGKNLADGLIKAGHARVYDGGKPLDWCE